MKEILGYKGEKYINIHEPHETDSNGFRGIDHLFTEQEWMIKTCKMIDTLREAKGDEYFPFGVRLIELHRMGIVSDRTIIGFMKDLGIWK